MSKPATSSPIRLALRREGDWWTAYIAKADDMDGAIEIAKIDLRVIQTLPDGPDRWKALLRDILVVMLTDIGAEVLSWDEHRAPESERSGRA